MTEVPGKKTQADEAPAAEPEVVSNAVPVIAVSLAALVVMGAAFGNSLPSLNGIAMPDFNKFLPSVELASLPDFSRFTPPGYRVAAAPPPPPPPPVLVPDPVVRAGLRDVQSSQEQNADMLMVLTQNSTAQAADLKRITRQLALLSAQVNSLQNPATPPPAMTSSIPPATTPSAPPSMPFNMPPPAALSTPPATTSSIPRPSPRAKVTQASRKLIVPALPPIPPPPPIPPLLKPEGPYSVGGAPLSPSPAPGSGAS